MRSSRQRALRGAVSLSEGTRSAPATSVSTFGRDVLMVALLQRLFVDVKAVGVLAELSLLALAEEIVRLTGSTSEIVYEALPIDDPKIRCPDITKAMHLLDWHPQIDLHEGLRRVWEYELSTQSHSVTGPAGDVLEKLLRAQPAGGGDTAP